MKKNIEEKIKFMSLGYRLDHKLLFGPLGIKSEHTYNGKNIKKKIFHIISHL
jgi:hypothetical protein